MKIAIDARWILPRISGIGAYTRELLRALARLDSGHAFTVFFDRADVLNRTAREADLLGRPRFTLRVLPWTVFAPASQLHLPALLRNEQFDVFHSPNYMIPLLAFPRRRPGRTRAVVTIHDVIPLLIPDHAPRSRKSRFFFLYRALMAEIARRADAIIAVTEASRADCLAPLRIPAGRAGMVHAVPNGVSERFAPPANGVAPRRSPDDRTTPRECLYVGRADPYKNLTGLLQAFARARAGLPFPFKLVMAGPRDDRYPEAPELARKLGVSDHVEWTGYLSDAELVRRYQTADLLCLPSRYEGFGLPVAEAMACGTPVVCGTAAALREIASGAALFADPDDWDGLAAGMRDILTQPALAARLARAGLERAASFTWARTAARTLEVYEWAAALPATRAP